MSKKNKSKSKRKSPARVDRPVATQDHKPKGSPKADATSMIVTGTVDGVAITVDMSAARNMRLMRRVKANDMDAVVGFYELTFGDQLDELEERFDLSDIEDYNTLFTRVLEAANPNS